MKAQIPGLGAFSKLPYELREQIWLHFLPVGEEPAPSTKTSVKADLRVLLTSRDLYEEISTVLYSKTCLHVSISLQSESDLDLWCTIYFTRPSRRRRGPTDEDQPAAWWRLESSYSGRDLHFDNFPFHKIRAVEVSLPAPSCDIDEELIWLWRNVSRTCQLLHNKPSPPPPLIIQLQKCETHDWCDRDGEARNLSSSSLPLSGRKYDLLVLPFYNLRQFTTIKPEPHSEELRRKMDWTWIDWASDVVSKRNGDCEINANGSEELELDMAVFDNYLWVHDQIFYPDWMYYSKASLSSIRGEWICEEFSMKYNRLKRHGQWITAWHEIRWIAPEFFKLSKQVTR
ncbi:hypothetical protein FQN54_006760 [Arachnomyces sp. PD_36]|nr:hypothetical protein FQN54_006760 [Arachnomyces sp. PD_36]